MEINSEKLAQNIAKAASEKKANDIEILDVRGISVLADYFIICSGSSNTQVRAIINEVEGALAKEEIYPKSKEGTDSGMWAVLDYADAIVHVFHDSKRENYKLEELWGDAKKVEIK